MTLGTSIILAAILPTVVFLFAITKDRWNWRRILACGILTPSLIIIFVGSVTYYYSHEKVKPARSEVFIADLEIAPIKQFEFFDSRLGMKSEDVKFAKGEPEIGRSADRWIYDAVAGSPGFNTAKYLIGLKDKHVRFIVYGANENEYSNPNIFGFTLGSTYQEIQTKLGKPTHISISNDNLKRMISYDELNVVFHFAKGRLTLFGIYEPTDGLMEFVQ
jgi:hypothetical protein